MKSHSRFFKQFPVTHTHCALILKGRYCAFRPVFQMMKCFLIVCVSLIQRRLGVSGAELWSVSMLWVVSIHSIFIQNAPFSVNVLWRLCFPAPIISLYQFGWLVSRTLPSGGKSVVYLDFKL